MAMAVMLAGLAVVEALDQYGATPLVATFLPALPLAIGLVVAYHLRSISFGNLIRGGSIDSWTPSWALAGAGLSAVLLVAAPVGTALGGWVGLVLIAGLVAGLLLSSAFVMPALRATGSVTIGEAIGRRFGSSARVMAIVAIVAATLPLVTAEAALSGTVAGRMLGLSPAAARDIIIVLAAIACILGGLRAAIGVAAVLAPIVGIAYLLPVTLAARDGGFAPLPWVALADPTAFEAGLRIPLTVTAALLASLIVGVAAMPTLLFPAWSTLRNAPKGMKLALGPAIVAVVLLAAPGYAVFGQRAGIDATTNPAGLVLNFPERAGLSSAPSVLLIGGLLAAALVAIALHLATTAAAVGHDLYGEFIERRAPEGRQMFIGRAATVLAAALAIAIGHLPGANVAMLASVGLSISAAALGPILLVAWRQPGVGSEAAVAAMAVGLWLTAANVLLASLAPEFSARFLGMGSVLPTVLGPTGWFGLPAGLSGLIGFVCGVLTLAAFTLLPRVNWPLVRLKARWLARRGRREVEALAALAATHVRSMRAKKAASPAHLPPPDAAALVPAAGEPSAKESPVAAQAEAVPPIPPASHPA